MLLVSLLLSACGTYLASSRGVPVAARYDAGDLYLMRNGWDRAYVNELDVFPNGRNDEQVDATGSASDLADDPKNASLSFA